MLQPRLCLKKLLCIRFIIDFIISGLYMSYAFTPMSAAVISELIKIEMVADELDQNLINFWTVKV